MNIPATSLQSLAFVVTDRVARLTRRLRDRSEEHVRAGTLNSSAIARVSCPRGQRITCVSGALWLTFDGQPEDYVLEAGQSMFCEHDAPLLIAALGLAAWRAD